MTYQRKSDLKKNNYETKKTRIKPKKVETNLKISRDQTKTEAELQKEIVKKLRCYQDLFIIYNDPVSPALKFISDQNKRIGFIQYSKSRGWSAGQTDLLIVWHGKPTFLELKHDGKTKGKLRPEQVSYKERVIAAGYEWQSWRTIDECVKWINLQLDLYKEDKKEDGKIC